MTQLDQLIEQVRIVAEVYAERARQWDLLEHGKAGADSQKWQGARDKAHLMCDVIDYQALLAELEAAKRVLSRAKLTADGAAVFPDDSVWEPWPRGAVEYKVSSIYPDMAYRKRKDGETDQIRVEDAYSTKELADAEYASQEAESAARAARQQEEDGRRYQCERCGGTGQQEAGLYRVESRRYDSKAGTCELCGGTGKLGRIEADQQQEQP